MFTSLYFLPLLAASIVIARSKNSQRRILGLLLASLVFYGANGALELGLLLAVASVSFGCGLAVEKWPGRTPLCAVCVLMVLTPLFVVKYAPSLLPAARVAGVSVITQSGRIPPGLSFLTLQAVGYVIDVYRGILPANRHPVLHTLFLSYFPQLVAGPIERAKELLPQLASPRRPGNAEYYQAGKLALWGYTLKLVLADQLAAAGDLLRAEPIPTPAASVCLLTLFAVQIYFDFYAYSCLAMAFGQAHGVRLTRNFRYPYAARSPIDFWRRWHISLSSWWRDYVYIPLGGSRNGTRRWLVATSAVFLLSGIWHGVGAAFVAWGAAHALLVMADHFVGGCFQGSPGPRRVKRMWSALAHVATVPLICLLWLPFIEPRFPEMLSLLGRVIEGFAHPVATLEQLPALVSSAFSWVTGLAFVVVAFDRQLMTIVEAAPPSTAGRVLAELLLVDGAAILLLILGDMGGRSFIYFRF